MLSLDPQTGTLTLDPDAVKDNTDVVATNTRGTDTAPEAKVEAGSDPVPAVATITIDSIATDDIVQHSEKAPTFL